MYVPFQIRDILTVRWDHRPIRVLQSDTIEIFYDAEMDEVGWVMAKARTAIYYRTLTRHLRENASYVLPKPFTAQEYKTFRPDLPMRLFRHYDANWSVELSILAALEDDVPMPVQEVAIIPFDPRGSAAKAVKVQASDGKHLHLRELIQSAHSAQRAECAEAKGIGMYRSGVVGGLPSYYLWGATDRAGHAV